MDNALLVSLSQQMAAYQSMDVIANNVANVSTPGYRREEQTFRQYIEQLPPAEGDTGTQTLSFVQDAGIVRDMSEGPMRSTGATYDLALHGKGFFVVQTPNGERYTRNGHFSLDTAGQIVDDAGEPLQGDGGSITINTDDGDIHIGTDGTLSGKNGQIAKLRVAGFANEAALAKEGASLFSTTQTPTTATNAEIRQGSLEESNVQPVVEISKMVEVMRAYQATATMAQSQEDLLRQAIDKLGSTPSS
ncbi:MAG TPA: flagellar basal-body rod protein FlgF [Rhizomicrobium sp.]|jgi:flagellar basal-body rod protein FlgF|nr:flagellar basal-body rod protein FlgF [Rhizomicrobium sp.]